MRHELSYQSPILRFSFLFLRQLSVCSSKLVYDHVEVVAGTRMLSNLKKLAIEIRDVCVQSEGH